MTLRRRGARIVATVIDVACMLPWIGVVAAAGAVLWVTGVTHSVDDIVGNVLGFVTLIVPITVTASGFEGSARHATPGKRLLRLTVERSIGGGPGFSRSLLRNGIKYALPWELAHTAVFALIGSTGHTEAWVIIVLAAAYAVPIVSLVLLLATGRALHDRVVRTTVASVA
jgi:uncharacterized RDD family membrane protein YckC